MVYTKIVIIKITQNYCILLLILHLKHNFNAIFISWWNSNIWALWMSMYSCQATIINISFLRINFYLFFSLSLIFLKFCSISVLNQPKQMESFWFYFLSNITFRACTHFVWDGNEACILKNDLGENRISKVPNGISGRIKGDCSFSTTTTIGIHFSIVIFGVKNHS